MCDLISLGDFCGAYALILQPVFKVKPNMLFDLGFFDFNNIIKYLNKNDLSEIYKTDYLVKNRTNEPILNFSNELIGFVHCKPIQVKNKEFGFVFNHDFNLDEQTNTITNYEYVKNAYDEKIKETLMLFKNEKPIVFLNFTDNDSNFDIKGMIEALNKYVSKKFYIIIFATNPTQNNVYENVFKIKIEFSRWRKWWGLSREEKNILTKEIYEKFYLVMTRVKLDHNFPKEIIF